MDKEIYNIVVSQYMAYMLAKKLNRDDLVTLSHPLTKLTAMVEQCYNEQQQLYHKAVENIVKNGIETFVTELNACIAKLTGSVDTTPVKNLVYMLCFYVTLLDFNMLEENRASKLHSILHDQLNGLFSRLQNDPEYISLVSFHEDDCKKSKKFDTQTIIPVVSMVTLFGAGIVAILYKYK